MGGDLRKPEDESIREEVFEHVVGPAHGLRLGLSFTGTSEEDRASAWGRGVVWLQGKPLWYSQDGEAPPRPVEWSWLDLLEFLGKFWQRIALEQQYPLRLTPQDPTELRSAAEKRWDRLSSRERRLEEDEAIARFEVRHDLARGMRGIYLPSILLMREGKMMWACAEERRLQLPAREVLDTLGRVGDVIVEQLGGCADPRAQRARMRWTERSNADLGRKLELSLGLSSAELEALQGDSRAHEFWELEEGSFEDSELSAAARMSGGKLQPDVRSRVLSLIRKLPHVVTPTLDAMSTAALAASQLISDTVPEAYNAHEEGRQLARWLRSSEGVVDDQGRVDPRALLERWGVPVKAVRLNEKRLAALACWGPRHGPAVLLNKKEGTRASTRHGKRSTLAHEICHLLVDRDGSLPVAEILGGNVPARPERRANAFAAELLLPREAAAAEVLRSPDIETAVERLCQQYGVSKQIVAWQITNGDVYPRLKSHEQDYIDALTDPPARIV